ncbi:MAG: sigma-70 family RNA polymerase sigma factor [Planctomycetes bacterium]|nr:sigma-70 family RNA polymerase sigma factor [Planctomycetota bacterium]
MTADDAALIRRVLAGDNAAYGALVERYWRHAHGSAYAVLGNAGDAEEIAQETFVQVYEKLSSLREPGALSSWVWRIARDTALKHLRKHKRLTPTGELPEPHRAHEPPEAALLAGEEKSALLAALGTLPDDMREALQMRYWEELDYDAMADRTGVSAAALYQRVCRGLKRLREILERGPEAAT